MIPCGGCAAACELMGQRSNGVWCRGRAPSHGATLGAAPLRVQTDPELSAAASPGGPLPPASRQPCLSEFCIVCGKNGCATMAVWVATLKYEVVQDAQLSDMILV